MVAGPQIISSFFFATSERWRSDPKFTFTLGFLLLVFFPSDIMTLVAVGANLGNHGEPWWHVLPFILTLLFLALPVLPS